MKIVFHNIGVIHSEHTIAAETPIQPVFAKGCKGKAEILPEYTEGLRDIEGFSHIYLIYLLHKAGPLKLTVKPFLQDVEHGVFATRAPCRPSPIGLSIVRLIRQKENILYLDDLDILDGTPLLDLKPYTVKFDSLKTTKNGWQDKINSRTAQIKGKREYQKKGDRNAKR